MGCQNSSSVQPIPHEVIEQQHLPSPKHQQSPAKTNDKKNLILVSPNIKDSATKQNKSPPRKPTVKFQPETSRIKSKSEKICQEVQVVDVTFKQNETKAEQKKKTYILPKLKSGSVKKHSERVISVGPSCISIQDALDQHKEELKNNKIVFDKKQVEHQVEHFEGQPLNQVKTESLGSQKVCIQPFIFQIEKSLKRVFGSHRSLVPHEKQQVSLFMENLIQYQNEYVQQQIQNKEQNNTQFKQSNTLNTQKIMQEEVLQDQKRMQQQLLASLVDKKDQKDSPAAKSYNTDKIIHEQILEGQKKMQNQVIDCLSEIKPKSFTKIDKSEGYRSINTEKMMQEQIQQDQKRLEEQILNQVQKDSTPNLQNE